MANRRRKRRQAKRLANRAAAVLGKGGMAPAVTPAATPPAPAMAPIPAAPAAAVMPGAAIPAAAPAPVAAAPVAAAPAPVGAIPAAGGGQIRLGPAPRGIQGGSMGGGIRARRGQPQMTRQNLMRQRGAMTGVRPKRRKQQRPIMA